MSEMMDVATNKELEALLGWEAHDAEIGRFYVDPEEAFPGYILEMDRKMPVVGNGEFYCPLLKPFEMTGEALKAIIGLNFKAFSVRLLYGRRFADRKLATDVKKTFYIDQDPKNADEVVVMVPSYGISGKAVRGKCSAEKMGACDFRTAQDGTEIYFFALNEKWNTLRMNSAAEFQNRMEAGKAENDAYQAEKETVRKKMEAIVQHAAEEIELDGARRDRLGFKFEENYVTLHWEDSEESADVEARYTERQLLAVMAFIIDITMKWADTFEGERGAFEFEFGGEVEALPYWWQAMKSAFD